MNQSDVTQLGRMVGLAIIIVGFVLSIWNATDLGYGGKDDSFRYFVGEVLTWLAWGSFVYLAAEIADRVGTRRP